MSKQQNSSYRILLVWNYERIDCIQPFLDLEDQFHFFFLNKFKEEDDQFAGNAKNIKRIYWTDYSGPGAILDEVKPQAIIFMSLIHFTDIILNSIAKKRKIS